MGAGSHLVLYGPRGSGKSTLIKVIRNHYQVIGTPCGLAPQTSGLPDIIAALRQAYPDTRIDGIGKRAARARLRLAADHTSGVLLLDHATAMTTAMLGYLRRLRGGIAGALLVTDIDTSHERDRMRAWRAGALSIRIPRTPNHELRAALYHMLNHSLYKALLFFGAGAVEAQTGTRDMDRLGGLIKWMPLTALVFLAGTLSIAALPPFNGFVSEWLTLQAMLRSAELTSIGAKITFALCGAGLALTAALAVTCFVKVFAMSFLGMRRNHAELRVIEAAPAALVSMSIVAVLCLALGVLPTYLISILNPASTQLTGASASDALVPPFFASAPGHDALPRNFVGEFHDLGAQVGQSFVPGRGLVVLHRGGTANPVVFAMSTSYMLLVLSGFLLLTYLLIRVWLTRARSVTRHTRWDGGVRRLLPEMTYTATGFSNPVRVIFEAIFRPTTVADTRETVAEHFRMAIRREKERVYVVDRLVYQPMRSAALWLARALAAMHHGRINAYVTYAFAALLIALAVLPIT